MGGILLESLKWLSSKIPNKKRIVLLTETRLD